MKKRIFRWRSWTAENIPQFVLFLFVFIVIFVTHYRSRTGTITDSRWVIPESLSIIHQQNTDLDEYRHLMKPVQYPAIDSFNHHLYNRYPVGTVLLSLPPVWVIDQYYALRLHQNLYTREKQNPIDEIELLIAAFFVAITACILFSCSNYLLQNNFCALIITFVFAFCTSAWSTASRALWQHGPSMLVLSTVLWLLIRAKNKPAYIRWLAIPVACSFVVRPTNILSVILISLYVFLEYRRYFIQYVLMSLIVAVPFFIYNVSIYNSLLSPYYFDNTTGNNAFFLAFAGCLFSPGRGILIYSPVLIFSVFGIIISLRNKNMDKLNILLAIIILAHLIMIARVRVWWGGWSFGPRLFIDMLPYCMYFMTFFFQKLSGKKGVSGIVVILTFIVTLIISFYINYQGANNPATFHWNESPNNIDDHPERLWQWNDPPFLRH